jgi:hypothetical protein
MAWLGLGLGQFGSQLGEAKFLGQEYKQREQLMREREQQMALERARQKQAEMMLPLQMLLLRQQTEAFNRPHFLGTVGTLGGGTRALLQQPRGELTTQDVAAGMNPLVAKAQIGKMISEVPQPEYKNAFQAISDSIDAGVDPLTALQHADTLFSTIAGKEAVPKKAEIKAVPGGYAYEVTDAQGKSWNPSDPQLPPELKALVDNYNSGVDTAREHQAEVEARKNTEALNRAMTLQDHGAIIAARKSIEKTMERGVAGHSFVTTIKNMVEEARKTHGQSGTTSGDLLIIEGYMQTMFGIDPRALRGSPKMVEFTLKEGGVDDRTIAWWNTIKSGGRLDQPVREEILRNSLIQIQSWDQAVRDNVQLVDDPVMKQRMSRYVNMYPPAAEPNNDLSDLGGKKVKPPGQ